MNTDTWQPHADLLHNELRRQPLLMLPTVFFDVETTGLFPSQGHRVCEVALLRVRGNDIQDSFSALVDPQRAIGEQAFAVNGISSELLQGAPTFAAVADRVMTLLDGAVVVAHNAPFDIAFLSSELALLNRPAPTNPVLDTLILARRLLRRSSYSLRSLATDLGLHAPSHRAMSDVLALQGLFNYLLRPMTALGITTLEDALRYQRGLLPGQPDPVPPPMIQRALREGRQLRIVYRSRSNPAPTERLIRPLEITQEGNGIYLRAFCFLRDDWRSFALDKIEMMELV